MAGGMCGRWQGVHGKGGYMHGVGGACVVVGGMHGREEACVAGGHAWQGGMHGKRDGHCSRRYASYWNAFLSEMFPL